MSSIRVLERETLQSFAATAHTYRDRLLEGWLVAPWFSSGQEKSALNLLVETFGKSGTLNVVTRPPIVSWHSQAIALLQSVPGCVICTCPNLHSKLYLLRCNGFRFAVVGSPNFTERGDRVNREIAIELRTSFERTGDEIATVVSALEGYAAALRLEDSVRML